MGTYFGNVHIDGTPSCQTVALDVEDAAYLYGFARAALAAIRIYKERNERPLWSPEEQAALERALRQTKVVLLMAGLSVSDPSAGYRE